MLPALAAGIVVLATAALSAWLTYRLANENYLRELRDGMQRLAAAAATSVDVAEHRRFRRPDQQNTPEFWHAAAGLRRFHEAVPHVTYVYTLTLDGDTPRFVLDPTPPGDADGDGVEDQSKIWEAYEEAAAEPRRALREGVPTVDREPYADRWGTFISAYHPLRDEQGVEGVVGVDMSADEYLARRGALRCTALWSMLPATLFSALVGGVVFMARRHSAVAQARRAESEVALRESVESLRAANERLAAASRAAAAASDAKSQFLANMSHEIRTPMTAILGFCDLLLAGEAEIEPEAREHLQVIHRNGQHLLTIINDILDLSKIEAGKLVCTTSAFSPRELLEEVVCLLRVRADAKGLRLELLDDGTLPPTIESDAMRLRQILVNLAGNAVKFTQHGHVRIAGRAVRRQERAVLEIEVADTGIGMTKTQLASLFTPFTQADESMTRRFGGTGLGLAISRRLAELLGGGIDVTAEPGVGSTFRVWVDAGIVDERPSQPTAEAGRLVPSETQRASVAASPAVVPRPASAAPAFSAPAARILFAEDGPDNQRLVSLLLRKAGYWVEVVDNGQLAVDAFIRAEVGGQPFDLVLTDMQMPVMDGYAVVRTLRARGCRRPILALTAHAMESDRARCLEAGCSGYLTKPIDRATLLETIARVLAGAPCGAA